VLRHLWPQGELYFTTRAARKDWYSEERGRESICRMQGLRVDIRANPMLLDVAPRGTPEIRMISILVLSFCPVCHLLFVVHSRVNKFRLARRGRAVLRRKGFRASCSLFILSLDLPLCWSRKSLIDWSIVIDCGPVEPQDVFKTGKCPYGQLPLFYKESPAVVELPWNYLNTTLRLWKRRCSNESEEKSTLMLWRPGSIKVSSRIGFEPIKLPPYASK